MLSVSCIHNIASHHLNKSPFPVTDGILTTGASQDFRRPKTAKTVYMKSKLENQFVYYNSIREFRE